MSVERDDDIDMRLYDPRGSEAGSSTAGTGQSEQITVNNPASGVWKLHVYEFSIGGSTANVRVEARVERVERQTSKIEIISISSEGCTYNNLPYLSFSQITGCKINVKVRLNNVKINDEYQIVPLYYTEDLGYIELPHTGGIIHISYFESGKPERDVEIVLSGMPLMGGAGEKSIILLVLQTSDGGVCLKSPLHPTPITEKSINVYFSPPYNTVSSPFIKFEKDHSYAIVIIFGTENRYDLERETPFTIYATLLGRGIHIGSGTTEYPDKGCNTPKCCAKIDRYNNKELWEIKPIENAVIYMIYGRRKGPDISEASYRELIRYVYRPPACWNKFDVAWRTMNLKTSVERLQEKTRLNRIWGVVYSTIQVAPPIDSLITFTTIIKDALCAYFNYGCERPMPVLPQIYPQFFDYNKYSITHYIYIGPPSNCYASLWFGLETKLKFTREYNNGEITAIILINDYYHHVASIRLNVG